MMIQLHDEDRYQWRERRIARAGAKHRFSRGSNLIASGGSMPLHGEPLRLHNKRNKRDKRKFITISKGCEHPGHK